MPQVAQQDYLEYRTQMSIEEDAQIFYQLAKASQNKTLPDVILVEEQDGGGQKLFRISEWEEFTDEGLTSLDITFPVSQTAIELLYPNPDFYLGIKALCNAMGEGASAGELFDDSGVLKFGWAGDLQEYHPVSVGGKAVSVTTARNESWGEQVITALTISEQDAGESALEITAEQLSYLTGGVIQPLN